MALEIGQVVGGLGIFSVRRGASPDDTAQAIETDLGAPEAEQAPPLTGVAGIKPLSGDALQTLQGADETGDKQEEADGKPGEDLSEEEQKAVAELKKRDQEVRRHEAAHAAAGGSAAGAPTFTYTKGPDGQRYATGGEVSIDMSPGRTAEETIRKADQVRAAALAPADPSGQDRAVAAAATQMKAAAQAQAAKERREEFQAKQAEDSEEPQVPGAPKAEDKQAQIVGPKPIGQKDEAAPGEATPGSNDRGSTGQGLIGQGAGIESANGNQQNGSGAEPNSDRRFTIAASAYSRTDDSLNRTSRTAANALSLVA